MKKKFQKIFIRRGEGSHNYRTNTVELKFPETGQRERNLNGVQIHYVKFSFLHDCPSHVLDGKFYLKWEKEKIDASVSDF